MTVRIGSLCSGYGGLDMGLMSVVGGTVAWHAEYDDAPSKILAHHWPGVPNLGDLTATDWSAVEPVDWLTAGYPCQPFSLAGKRKGATDVRHLWPHIADAVGVLRPGHVLLENVAGHLSLGLGTVLGDLAGLGYDAAWGVVRAAEAGAPHRRARIFIVAATDADRLGGNGGRAHRGRRAQPPHGDRHAADTDGIGRGEGRPESAGRLGGSGAVVGGASAAYTQRGRWDGGPCGQGRRPVGRTASAGASQGSGGGSTPADTDLPGSQGAEPAGGLDAPAWGAYEPAITRWERATGRAAPAPVETGPKGGARLSPRFVEWLMGLPAGHVTDVPGLTRNQQLKALGNGVVPQQAALALTLLLTGAAEAA